MTDSSEVEARIRTQIEQASHDSEGQFTLDRRHALKKMRNHLLPSPTYWILKVVQAAVAAGAPELSVEQTGATTQITWLSSWTLDELEAAFLDAEDGTNPGVNHLKRGLWSLTGQVDGFVLVAGDGGALNWSADGLFRMPRPASGRLALTVQHANVDQRWLQALGHELGSRAYTCPIPLTLNGKRLDDLRCDANHPDSNAYHMSVIALDGLPPLTIPSGTYRAGSISRLGPLQVPPDRPQQASAACVLHLGETGERRLSLIHWVLDGVIVCSQPLHNKSHDCWCNLYASAKNLPLDLGGFRLTDTTRSAGIAYEISRAFYPTLSSIRIDFSPSIQRRRKTNRRAGTACVLIGASVLWTGVAGLGVGLLAFLAAIATSRDDGGREEERTLQVGLAELQASWPGAPEG